jgi:hypothetical protein
MPEPSDPLSERLAAAPGLPTLLAEARATWLARAERDAGDPAASGPAAERDADVATAEASASRGGEPSVRVRPSRPRWRAFEDAFPTFYQFTNRPRG